MYTLWQGRSPTIVISDPAIAQDLMEKRSQIYSSRPRMIVMGEVFTNNRGLLTSPYNEYWRRLRKMYPPKHPSLYISPLNSPLLLPYSPLVSPI
jgi:hypothetical protein